MPLTNCPLCDEEWGKHGVMRKPLKNIRCPVCLAERKRRIAYTEERKRASIIQLDKGKEKWDAITPEERRAYTNESLRLLWGSEEFDNRRG